MAKNLSKTSTVVAKGKQEGKPVFTGGAAIRFVGLPVGPDGAVNLASQSIIFKGCFGGDAWFYLLDYTGKFLQVSTQVTRNVPHIPGYLDAAPSLLPVKDPGLFEGIQVVIPILSQVEDGEKSLDIYFET
jgi:hypothetical protein